MHVKQTDVIKIATLKCLLYPFLASNKNLTVSLRVPGFAVLSAPLEHLDGSRKAQVKLQLDHTFLSHKNLNCNAK